jgi:ribosomal protein L16 Arg81 hydroxylase
MQEPDLSFGRVIAPLDVPTFLARHYEREPLVVSRGDPGHHAPLVSLDRLDHYLSATLPRFGDVILVKFGHDQDHRAYTTADGRVDPARVWSMFADGWTIVFNNLHCHLPELAGLCRAAEAVFSQPFQTNLYLTPAGAQGFKPHWDTHDVFVLQVVGSKDWLLYDTKVELPLVGQGFDADLHKPGPVSREVTLRAGDTLYCPRGLMHDARATEEVSLHITFGLMGRTWADLLFESLADFVLNDVEARRLLPPGYARPGFDPRPSEAQFRALLERFAKRAELAPRLAEFADAFVDGRQPILGGQMRQVLALDRLGPETRLGARPDLVFRLRETEDTITVQAHGGEITVPRFAAPALTFALEQPSYTPADLPGELDIAGRVTLLRRLVAEGLVRIHDA